MIRTGFTTVTFRNMSIEDVCKLADDNDIRFIEWGGDIHLPPDSQESLKKIISLKEKYALNTLSYGSYYRLTDENYESWDKITNTAAAVGADIVRIWMGRRSSSETSEKEKTAMIKETVRLAETAEKKNLSIAFEFHKNTYNDTAQSCIDFIEKVARPNVKTYWQPFGFGNDEETLRAVLPYVVGVHVFQWDADYNRYPLSEGTAQWRRFIEIISERKDDMNYIMEFVRDDSPAQFREDLKTLRMLLGNISETP